jgi:uncharacterized protein
MSRAFAEIAFTDSVKAVQSRMGSRAGYSKLEHDKERRDNLTDYETAFLAERDSFYMASVGENGWPYMQHRGGPIGFVKVLDDKTLGFADFRGNRQYISVGNVSVDDRVSLFFMDYAGKQRLKIWARARIVEGAEDAELLAKLHLLDYPAKVERGVILSVEALDWNCPQHITPRFSEAEVRQIITPLLEDNRELKAKLAQASIGERP